jgi:hypothetical protein
MREILNIKLWNITVKVKDFWHSTEPGFDVEVYRGKKFDADASKTFGKYDGYTEKAWAAADALLYAMKIFQTGG